MQKEGLDTRRLRAGIVGGGQGAFMGSVHRIAAELDGQCRVVAGAMSGDPARARSSADAWFLERSYDSFLAMAAAEAVRADGIDFVIVATPNFLHYPVAKAFLEAGIPVICDKPLALTVAESESLVEIGERTGSLFALTHNYTGYPAVREARAIVQAGRIGELRKVLVEYQQDWLSEAVETTGNKQAEWRTDPARAGAAGCIGDIGTHAENLLEFIVGREIESLCADLSTFVPGRRLDDDANVLFRLRGGGKGTLVCSQVACGEENALSIRVYGSTGGIEWRQQEPSTLVYKPSSPQAWQLLRRGKNLNEPAASAATRLPAGHPEGYLEAFAVIYRDFIADIRRVGRGEAPIRNYPGLRDGLRGMRFVAACVESASRGAAWVTLP